VGIRNLVERHVHDAAIHANGLLRLAQPPSKPSVRNATIRSGIENEAISSATERDWQQHEIAISTDDEFRAHVFRRRARPEERRLRRLSATGSGSSEDCDERDYVDQT
jgi:hypothetical protein